MTQNRLPALSVRGFTLIELLIVIGIIGVLVAIAVPIMRSSMRKANEANAVSTLNTVKLAEAKYVTDHKEQYGTFKELFEDGYLDKRFNFDEPHLKGYVFILTLTPKSPGRAASFSVNANPEQWDGMGATGKNFYYIDADSGIATRAIDRPRPQMKACELISLNLLKLERG